MATINFKSVPLNATIGIINSIVPTPRPTYTPPPTITPQPYIGQIEYNNKQMEWSEFEPYLLSKDVSNKWNLFTKSKRKEIATFAIKNRLNYMVNEYANGKCGCAGDGGVWKRAVCVSNAVIRYLIFTDNKFDVIDCNYWRRHNRDPTPHCYKESCYFLPGFMVGAYNTGPDGSDMGHAMCGIHIGNTYDSIDDFLVYQYSEINIKWGNWQMPDGCTVVIDIPSSFRIASYRHNSHFKSFKQ